MIKGTVSLGSLTAVSIAVGALSTMLVARHFPAEDFGVFVLLSVLVSFLTQVSSLGLDASVTRYLASTEEEPRRQALIGTAIPLRLLAIVITSLLAWVGRPFLLKLFGASVLGDLVAFVPLLFCLESTQNLLKSILQGCFCFSRVGVTDLITSCISLLLILAMVSYASVGAVGLVLARAIALFVAGAYAYLSIPVKKAVFRQDMVVELARFGFPLQINDVLHFVFTRVDTLAIGALLGPADIAVYEIARKIPDSLSRLFEPFRSVYFTFSSRLSAEDERGKTTWLLNDSARTTAFVTVLGAAIALVYGRDIICLAFSAKYLRSVPLFALLMVNLSASLVGNVLGTTLVALGEPDKPVIINVFNTVVSWLGVVLLTSPWGAVGAAVGTLLGTITTLPPATMFLRRRTDARPMTFLKPMAIFLPWAASVLALKPAGHLAKAGIMGLFLLACVLLSVVTKDDLRLLVFASGSASWGPLRRLTEGIERT